MGDVRALGVIMFCSALFAASAGNVWGADEPPSKEGLVLWLKADSLAGAAEGSAVKSWKDESGANHSVAQEKPEACPKFVPQAINGKPAVRFEGNQVLSSAEIPDLGKNSFSVFIAATGAAMEEGAERGYLAIDDGTAAGHKDGFWIDRSTWGHALWIFSNNSNFGAPERTAPTAGFGPTLIEVVKSLNTNLTLYMNGAAMNSSTVAAATAPSPRNTVYIGRSMLPCKGDIAEVLIYARALSDAERHAVETYLMAKYGIAAAMPLGSEKKMTYNNTLEPISKPLPILADYPKYVEPLQYENQFLAAPLVNDKDGTLLVRSWRYWYNARGMVEMVNRLDAKATAIVMVHPWGIDDGHGMKSPEPAGAAFGCTPEKNHLIQQHMREVVNPFLRQWRGAVALVAYSLPNKEDDIRKLLYASIATPPEKLDTARGERLLKEMIDKLSFKGQAVPAALTLGTDVPVRDYFAAAPFLDAGDGYNGAGYWDIPMPISKEIERDPKDLVFYDGEGYVKVRDFLKSKGVRNVLLIGYATDACMRSTNCGYLNLSQDFNVFIVGDVTQALCPASRTAKFATQTALAAASQTQMITQASWITLDKSSVPSK